MQTAMAESWTTQFGSMSEKLFLATTLTIVGFAIVFIALTIIIFCIKIMSASIRSISGRTGNPGRPVKSDPVERSIPEMLPISDISPDTAADDNDEIIAVISAAIAAASASQDRLAPYPGFRVRSIRRI